MFQAFRKTTFYILCSFFITWHLVSCTGSDSCDGSSHEVISYAVEGYDATNIEYSNLVNPYASQYSEKEYSVLSENEEISWVAYGIYLNAQYAISDVPISKVKDTTERFSLISKAYACSPAPDIHTQRISSISITSDNIFSETYPAGSELVELFSSLHSYFGRNVGEVPPSKLSAYGDTTTLPPLKIQLFLLEQPQFERHNFQISVALSDGNIFVVETGDVYLGE